MTASRSTVPTVSASSIKAKYLDCMVLNFKAHLPCRIYCTLKVTSLHPVESHMQRPHTRHARLRALTNGCAEAHVTMIVAIRQPIFLTSSVHVACKHSGNFPTLISNYVWQSSDACRTSVYILKTIPTLIIGKTPSGILFTQRSIMIIKDKSLLYAVIRNARKLSRAEYSK